MRQSVVTQAVLSAKEDMRKKFWEEHVVLELGGKRVVVQRDKAIDALERKTDESIYDLCNKAVNSAKQQKTESRDTPSMGRGSTHTFQDIMENCSFVGEIEHPH